MTQLDMLITMVSGFDGGSGRKGQMFPVHGRDLSPSAGVGLKLAPSM